MTRGHRFILYTGTIAHYRYDTFIEALRYFKDKEPVLANQVHFRFIGEGADAFEHSVSALGLNESVTVLAPSLMKKYSSWQDTHALLVLEGRATMAGHELFAAAKLFGYLKPGVRSLVFCRRTNEKNPLPCWCKTVASADSYQKSRQCCSN